MPILNSKPTDELVRAQQQLAQLKAEKLKLFPPNPHPFAQPDQFPKNATPEQIKQRNDLIARIEELERRIKELER
jgi:hypothetical protein